MKIGTALGAAALAAFMALSMTACGAASTNTASSTGRSYHDGEIYDPNRTDEYGPAAGAKDNASRDAADAAEKGKQAAENIGEDMKRAGRNGVRSIQRAYEQALENGRVENHTGAERGVKRNTGSGAGAIYGNGASGSTHNTTNAGVSLSGIR